MQYENNICLSCMKELPSDTIVCPHCRYDNSSPQNAPYLPLKVCLKDRYITGRVISSNGEGITYMCWDSISESPAIMREFFPVGLCRREENGKTVAPFKENEDTFDECLNNFQKLARSLARMRELSAQFPVYDIFDAGGTTYYITEYVEFISFNEFLIRNGGSLTWKQTSTLLMPVLSTLASFHSADIIHMGISPETLAVGCDGKVRLIGFCTSAVRSTRQQLSAQLFSGYSAIEQYGFDDPLGTWTDIYSFAAVIYRTLTGNTPEEASLRVTNDTMAIPSHLAANIPYCVIDALKNALQVMPDDRTKTAEQLRDELSDSPTVTAKRDKKTSDSDSKSGKKKKKKRGRSLLYLLLSLIGTGIIVALVVFGVNSLIKNTDVTSGPEFSAPSQEVASGTGGYTLNRVVPKLDKMTYTEAVEAANGQFEIKVEEKIYNDDIDRGQVISQIPTAGTNLSVSGTSDKLPVITVTLSLGKSQAKIPDLSGDLYEEAVVRLCRLGFSVENIEKKVDGHDLRLGDGEVISTAPVRDEIVSVDSKIVIHVNSNPEESSKEVSIAAPIVSAPTIISSYTPPAPVVSVPSSSRASVAASSRTPVASSKQESSVAESSAEQETSVAEPPESTAVSSEQN